ncbi:MAG: hypothetical protein AAGA65_18090 [Actinomycetota bacterium]
MNASHRERTDEVLDRKDEASALAEKHLAKLRPPADPIEAFAYWQRLAEAAIEESWRTVHESREATGEPPWWAVGAVLDVSSESARSRANYAYGKYGLADR